MTPLAFPWTSRQTLVGRDGTSLTWEVSPHDDHVVIRARHSTWSVQHIALIDGTPVSTLRATQTGTSRITWHAAGAEVELGARTVSVSHGDLWDRDTLDARLAGVRWRKGKQLRFHTIDPADGAVYPMLAEGLGPHRGSGHRCEAVKVTLDGWRAAFGSTLLLRYAPDGRYLGRFSAGVELVAPRTPHDDAAAR